MKKLNINNAGRMPLWQTDLDWMQQSYTEIIHELVKELANTGSYMFPVSGCRVTYNEGTGTVSMTAGWFWWDGELLPVRALPATPLEAANPHLAAVHLTRVTNHPEAGARNFIGPDLAPVAVADTWQDDYLQPEACLRNDTFASGVTICPGAWTLHDRLQLSESSWTEGTHGNLQYKRIGRMVVLKGTVYVSGTNPWETGLPAPIGGMAILHIGQLTTDLQIYVDADGGIFCKADTGTTTLFNVTGMTYMSAEPLIDMNVIVHV